MRDLETWPSNEENPLALYANMFHDDTLDRPTDNPEVNDHIRTISREYSSELVGVLQQRGTAIPESMFETLNRNIVRFIHLFTDYANPTDTLNGREVGILMQGLYGPSANSLADLPRAIDVYTRAARDTHIPMLSSALSFWSQLTNRERFFAVHGAWTASTPAAWAIPTQRGM